MRRGFMAATLEPSGAVVTVGLVGDLLPFDGTYQALGAYAPAPRPAERRAEFF